METPAPAPDTDLFSQTEFGNDGAIAFDVNLLEIAEKVSSVADHFLKAAAAVKVLLVGFEVLGQVVDAGCEDRDLNLGGTRIAFMNGILLDQSLLFVFLHHGFFFTFLLNLLRLTPVDGG